MKPENKIDFSINYLQLLISEKNERLTLNYLSSKIKSEQFKRLIKSGLLGIKKNKKTISHVSLNYSDFCKSLRVNVLLRDTNGGLLSEYGDYNNPKVNIVKVQDKSLVLSILEKWVIDGVNDIDFIISKLDARDEKKRAQELGLDLTTYLEKKNKGLVDWDPRKAYDISKGKWSYEFTFRGERELVGLEYFLSNSFTMSRVLGISSFDYTLIMALKSALQSPEEITLEAQKAADYHAQVVRSSSNQYRGRFENERVSCTSFSYDADGRQCKSHAMMSSGDIITTNLR